MTVGCLLFFSRFADKFRGLTQDTEWRGCMHIEHRIPLLIGHVLNHRVPGISCIVDDNVYTPKGVECGFNELSRKCGVGHIASHHDSFTPSSADIASSPLRRSRLEVAYHNRCSLCAEHFSCSRSPTASSAGQNSYFAINHTHT